MMSKQPPSWILIFFSRTSEYRPKLLKYTKCIKKSAHKNLKEVKGIGLKLIFINRNTINYKFGKTCLPKGRCHGNVEFLTQQPTLPIYFQKNFRKSHKVWQRLVESLKSYKRSATALSATSPPPPPPGLDWIGLNKT